MVVRVMQRAFRAGVRGSRAHRMGERDDALAGLARYCTAEASLAWKGLAGPAQAEWLDRVRDDLENYRGALAWLIEQVRSTEASNMAWELSVFWMIRGHAAEGLQWYEAVLNLPSIPPAAEAKALYGAALMWYSATLALAHVHGRRGSWAHGTPSPSAPARRLPTSR